MERISKIEIKNNSCQKIIDNFSKQHTLQTNVTQALSRYVQIAHNYTIQLDNLRLARSKTTDSRSLEYQQLLLDETNKEQELEKTLDDLNELMQTIEKHKDATPICVMCVVVSMTAREATFLQNSIGSKNSLAAITDELFNSLRIFDIQDISNFYRDNREEWIPYAHAHHFELEYSQQHSVETGQSIRDIISKLIKEFNRESNQFIVPSFVTEKFFEPPFDLWEDIRKQGGIIIVDAVSLLHDHIRRILLNSSVIGEEKIAILTIPPINPCNFQTNQILERFISTELQGMHVPSKKPFNRRCEIARGDFRSINTWFYTILNEKTQVKATAASISGMNNNLNLPEKQGINMGSFWNEQR